MLDALPDRGLEATPQDVGQPCSDPTPCSRNRSWLVVHTYAQAEQWADRELQRRGYTTYLPMMTVRRRDRALRSLWHTVSTPLFPRYLFCRIATGQWTPVRYCPGVYRLVSAAGQPNMAADADIEALQAAEEARRDDAAEMPQWAPGTPVALARGYAFEGMPAVVLSLTTRDQVRIGVMMLGALRQITVPPDALVARGD